MKESQAVVQRVRLLGQNTRHKQLELAVTKSLHDILPGQCLLVRPKAMRTARVWHPYLRQVWYPVHVSSKLVWVNVSDDMRYDPGDVFDVVGPVGQPFQYRRTLRKVLLLAYNTPPLPLLMAVPQLLGNNVGVTLVLLGTAADYPTANLPPEVEIVKGTDPDNPLDWPDQVVTIGWADQVFTVVRPGDEVAQFSQVWNLFQQRQADIEANYLFGVFQSVLPCGVGACQACLLHTRDGHWLACTDGPALDLSRFF